MTPGSFLLSRPKIRAEVIDALCQIGAGDAAVWMQDNPVEIDYIVNLFFNDNELAANPAGSIGDILTGLDEAQAIKNFVEALDVIIAELGDVNTRAYFLHPKWPEVRFSAKLACDKLQKRSSE